MTKHDPRLTPRGTRAGAAADRLTWRTVPLPIYRLLLAGIAAIVFLLAAIFDSSVAGTVAAGLVLVSALASRYSRDSSVHGFGSAFLPGLIGAGVAGFIGVTAGAAAGWHAAAWLAGVAGALFVIQVVLVVPWGKPSLEKQLEQIRRDLAEQEGSGDQGSGPSLRKDRP